ncbi:MCE family protein [Nocardioides rotundus]|uniref:MCE family protein n=1 Tax=Nocardioides rotundus TaxID=1774216 RepID=UPI001CBDA457|nr:MlaD family protein [Nocardioides rotundus]UAL30357.1 MCE family protein [Nocardioides rotundus]
MRILDKKTAADTTRLGVFVLVTTLATMILVVLIGNLTFGAKKDFKAVFTDATGVVKGDDIRIAGVRVGTVDDVEIVNRTRALVSFTVEQDAPITDASTLQIRFRNLVGQRYIAVTQGEGRGTALSPGATIPVSKTQPALDLTVLFNGFKPLFKALSPSDINTLSYEIVQVFQGEGGTVESLLARTASVTSTLADRDQVIGDLIQNLNTVLVKVGDRDAELTRLIKSFRTLVTGFKNDREEILGSLEDISALSVETADLVSEARRPLVGDIKQLRRVATLLNKPANKAELDRALTVLPIKLTKVGRTATYRSWFNFYLCEFKGSVTIPGLEGVLPGAVDEIEVTYPLDESQKPARCNLG